MLEHKYHYVYRIDHKESGDFYIGLRSCDCLPEQDQYFGSGIRISNAIKKHGKETFVKTILCMCPTRAEASKQEALIVNHELILEKHCLNLKTGGEYEFGTTYSNDTCQKMGHISQERFRDPNKRKMLSENAKQRFKEHPEIAEKISTSLKKHYQEHPESRIRISEQRKQKLQDPLFQEKIKIILAKLWEDPIRKENFLKRMHSPEARALKSQSLKDYSCSEKGRKVRSMATKDSAYMNKDGLTKRIQKENILSYQELGWEFGSTLNASDETRQKIGNVTRGRKWMYNIDSFERKRIKQEDIENYLNLGWKFGQKPSDEPIRWKGREPRFMAG